MNVEIMTELANVVRKLHLLQQHNDFLLSGEILHHEIKEVTKDLELVIEQLIEEKQ